MYLKHELYKKLDKGKIKIKWNKNLIKMDLFLSFLDISLDRSKCHLGSCTGWTKLFNKSKKLVVRGGIVNGVEYLDLIEYGENLDNMFNNFVSPFYLFGILSKEGRDFFMNYYKEIFTVIINDLDSDILYLNKELSSTKRLKIEIEKEIEKLKQ